MRKLLRKIVAAIILVPLAILIIAFAVANRQNVTVSLDPLSAEHPAAAVTLPLFALVFLLLIVGVLIGGAASWLRHGRWRRVARRLERELADLRSEIGSLKRGAGDAGAGGGSVPSAGSASAAGTPERLQLRAPVR